MSHAIGTTHALVGATVAVASDVLGAAVTPSDNFLLLGGTSLQAAQLAARIEKMVGGPSVTLVDVFEAPVIQDLATLIAARLASPPDPAVPPDQGAGTASTATPTGEVRQAGEVPLSHAQQRRLRWDLADGGRRELHQITDTFDLYGQVNVDAMAGACRDVTLRHPALRTIFTCDETGQFHAKRLDLADLECDRLLRVVRLSDPARPESEKLVTDEATDPFDLAADVKLRVMLLTDGDARHRITVTVEHLVCDGQSFAIVLRDLARAYAARCDEPQAVWRANPPVDAVWAEHERQICEANLPEYLDYWKANLDPLEVTPEIRLPGMCDPTSESLNTAGARITIPNHVVDGLQRACVEQSASLYCGFLSALALSVLAHTGRTIVGVVSATSIRPESWQDSVDWISWALIYRFMVDSSDSTSALIRTTRSTVINGIRNALPLSLLLGNLMSGREDQHRWKPCIFLDVATNSAQGGGLELPGVQVSRADLQVRLTARRSSTFLGVRLAPNRNSAFILYEDGTWQNENAQSFLSSFINSAELLAENIPCHRAVNILRQRHRFA